MVVVQLLLNFIVTELNKDTPHFNPIQMVEKKICIPVEVTRL